ncbi:AF4/FMR2 family member 1-like [Lates japonicus]
MTHSWPPLLTAIHTPSTDASSKSPFPAKEAEHVSSCLEQKSYDSAPPPTDPSRLNQPSVSSSFEAAHSSGVESASSSDSESSSRSESDSESTTEEPPEPPVSISLKTEPDAPAVSDWQLGNWIRSNQQNSSTESQGGTHVTGSPTHKQLLPTQSSKHSSVEVVDPARESMPQLSSHQKELSENLAKPQQCRESPQDNCCQQSSQKSPSADFRKLSCNMHPSKPAKEGCPDHSDAAVSVKCEEIVATRDKDPCFTDRPKVKTKTKHCKKSKSSSDSKQDRKRTCKHTSLDKRKAGSEPEATAVVNGHCPSCGVRYPNPCSCPTQSPALQPDQSSPAPPLKIDCSKPKAETTCRRGTKRPHKTTYMHSEKTANTTKGARNLHRPPRSLLVKIDLSLLSRVPQMPGNYQEIPSNGKRSTLAVEQDGGGGDAPTTHKHSKTSKKSIPPNVEVDNKSLPRKKPRLENKNTSSAHVSVKLESSSNPAEERERKRAKKNPVSMQQPATPKDTAKDSKVHKRCSGETQESSKKTVKSKNSCKHKKRSVKNTEHPHSEKKPPKSSLAVPSSSQSNKEVLINRPLLKFEDRQYPVKHYIKEAKRLKHKADAESDKLSKAFNYLDAAMFFVESGIAMEKDPQISMSSYTMFAETVELLKFVLKLKNPVDPSASPSEKDFLALCLKCQSLLQMAMFRHKHKTALKYSKTLNDHFTNSAQATHEPSVCSSKVTDTPSPMPDMPSPANTSTSSGPGSNHSGSGLAVGPVGSTVAVPQAIEQVAFTYVKITTLFLSAHDIWEQAEELAHKGSGMLTELDTVMGPLSLASTMSSMVRYTRQGVHWLRLDSQKVK